MKDYQNIISSIIIAVAIIVGANIIAHAIENGAGEICSFIDSLRKL